MAPGLPMGYAHRLLVVVVACVWAAGKAHSLYPMRTSIQGTPVVLRRHGGGLREFGLWRLRGGRGDEEDLDDERERVLRASIIKQLAQKAGAGTGSAKAKKVKPTKGNGLEQKVSHSESGDGDVFERDGLEFRRPNDDAKDVLHQMRAGTLGEDLLERAREFMDSDEVNDWDALYEAQDSDDTTIKANVKYAVKSSETGLPVSSPSKGPGAAETKNGDINNGTLAKEEKEGLEMDLKSVPTAQSTSAAGGNKQKDSSLRSSALRKHEKDEMFSGGFKTPPRKSAQGRRGESEATPASQGRKVSFSQSPVSVLEYPRGKQEWCTMEEVESAIEESQAEEEELLWGGDEVEDDEGVQGSSSGSSGDVPGEAADVTSPNKLQYDQPFWDEDGSSESQGKGDARRERGRGPNGGADDDRVMAASGDTNEKSGKKRDSPKSRQAPRLSSQGGSELVEESAHKEGKSGKEGKKSKRSRKTKMNDENGKKREGVTGEGREKSREAEVESNGNGNDGARERDGQQEGGSEGKSACVRMAAEEAGQNTTDNGNSIEGQRSGTGELSSRPSLRKTAELGVKSRAARAPYLTVDRGWVQVYPMSDKLIRQQLRLLWKAADKYLHIDQRTWKVLKNTAELNYNKKEGCYRMPTELMGIFLKSTYGPSELQMLCHPSLRHIKLKVDVFSPEAQFLSRIQLPEKLKTFFAEQKLLQRVWEEEDASECHQEPPRRLSASVPRSFIHISVGSSEGAAATAAVGGKQGNGSRSPRLEAEAHESQAVESGSGDDVDDGMDLDSMDDEVLAEIEQDRAARLPDPAPPSHSPASHGRGSSKQDTLESTTTADERTGKARSRSRCAEEVPSPARGSQMSPPGLDCVKRKDETGIFPAHVTWETKVEMLKLAKMDAWHNGSSRFSRLLFRWERLVGLRPRIVDEGLKSAKHKKRKTSEARQRNGQTGTRE